MKAFTIISLAFAILFVVLMVCSVLFYSVLMVICSIGCMFVSMLAMQASFNDVRNNKK